MSVYDEHGKTTAAHRRAANLTPADQNRITVESIRSPALRAEAARLLQKAETAAREASLRQQASNPALQDRIQRKLDARQSAQATFTPPPPSFGGTAKSVPLKPRQHENNRTNAATFVQAIQDRRKRENSRRENLAIQEPLERIKALDRSTERNPEAKKDFAERSQDSTRERFRDRARGSTRGAPRDRDKGLGD
jgi:hypothetical protein